MFEIDVPVQHDRSTFLSRTLVRGEATGEISCSKEETIRQEIAELSHKLITVKTEDVAELSQLRKQVQEAFVLVNLGLEYGSHGDMDRSVGLLNNNRIVKFFQIGNTLISELVDRCRYTLKNAVLVSPESSGLTHNTPNHLPVYNEWERQFLTAIDEHKLVVDSPQLMLSGVGPPRPITNLADLAIVRQQLDHIDNRFAYIQSLPTQKIFEAHYRVNADVDTAREITIALMVNLVLYREIDFHYDSSDLNNLQDIAFDTDSGHIKRATCERLINWINRYLDLAALSDEVKNYAVAYWQDAMKVLESELRLEHTIETADVLCP
ncbi:MAG: DUF6178 family protein [Candidatus Poribacteria bacterium]|nr:DUF6178 family protein [Candidatus Poribacteria bacterium]MDE0504408.1 DUF6178 family protein [Candidatus Poribacteria bacterium]